jgi:hypothetical protein
MLFCNKTFQAKIDEALKPLKAKLDEVSSKFQAPAAAKKEE